jgi:hypothetical protein
MEDIKKILEEIKNDYGLKIFEDPQKFKAVFADYAKGEFTDEKELYTKIIEAGTANEIKNSDDIPSTKNMLVKGLHYKYSLDEKLCADCIDLLISIIRNNYKPNDIKIKSDGVKKDNSVSNYKNGDEDILEYPDSFLNDKNQFFYIISVLNIAEAITAKKILGIDNENSPLTLKEIIKNTDVKLEETQTVLPKLVNASFAKEEKDANGNSVYLFEINNNEKQIIKLAEKQFSLTLENIIKSTDIEIEEIKTALEKLIKIGFFIKCGKKAKSEINDELRIDAVYYYVFSDQNIIESHLQYLLTNETNNFLVGSLCSLLPVSIDFDSYLISLLKDNRATFASKLSELKFASKLPKSITLGDLKDDLNLKMYFFETNYHIRKLGYLSIKNKTEQEWNKEIRKIEIREFIESLLTYFSPILGFGLLFFGVIFFMIIFDLSNPIIYFSISVPIALIIFIIIIYIFVKNTGKYFKNGFLYKRKMKSLNKLFEIPE